MAMTRKDFEAVATALQETRKSLLGGRYLFGTLEYNAADTALCRVEETLAIAFKQSNPRFDTLKFLRVCGGLKP